MKSTPEVRRSLPYVSEVGAVLLGLLAVVAVVLQFGPPGSAMVAGGSGEAVLAEAIRRGRATPSRARCRSRCW